MVEKTCKTTKIPTNKSVKARVLWILIFRKEILICILVF